MRTCARYLGVPKKKPLQRRLDGFWNGFCDWIFLHDCGMRCLYEVHAIYTNSGSYFIVYLDWFWNLLTDSKLPLRFN